MHSSAAAAMTDVCHKHKAAASQIRVPKRRHSIYSYAISEYPESA